MKNNKVSEDGSIVIEAIKEGGEKLLKVITTLFNKYLKKTKTAV